MFVRVGDINLFYEEAGKTEDSLVLLHGLGMNCELWRSQVESVILETKRNQENEYYIKKNSRTD